MTSRRWPLAVAACAFLAVLPQVAPEAKGQNAAKNTQPDWPEFVSNPGQFAVRFPGRPQEEGDPDTTSYVLDQDGKSFIAAFTRVAADRLKASSPKQLFLGTRDAVIEGNLQGTLRDGKMLQLKLGSKPQKYPGYEFAAENRDAVVYRSRLILVGDHLYQLNYATLKPLDSDEEFRRFADSFRLLGR